MIDPVMKFGQLHTGNVRFPPKPDTSAVSAFDPFRTLAEDPWLAHDEAKWPSETVRAFLSKSLYASFAISSHAWGWMKVVDKKEMNSRVGKTLFLIVMLVLVLVIANRIHFGSDQIAGALLGFIGLAAFFGWPLSTLLDRLFLTRMLGARTGVLASCLAIWVLLLAYLLTLRADGVAQHSPLLRVLGATIGMGVVFWLRRRRQERVATVA